MYIVYILKCNDDSLYTGIAKDVVNRLRQHNVGKASKYTRTRLPVTIVYQEVAENKSEALKREITIKKLTKKQKLQLINSNRSFTRT